MAGRGGPIAGALLGNALSSVAHAPQPIVQDEDEPPKPKTARLPLRWILGECLKTKDDSKQTEKDSRVNTKKQRDTTADNGESRGFLFDHSSIR